MEALKLKYIYPVALIFFITFLGEAAHRLLPLPVPASVYGLIFMLIALQSKIIKLSNIRQAGDFFLEIMPLLFIPAGVGLITVWADLKPVLLPMVIISLVTTVLVMAATGRVTQYLIRRERRQGS